ncbi:hydrogenase 4 subunit B [Vibrio mangrovi]|uniref:Hydrogenase 4 subunit B n=1 Tax=Vibrio mangrovi TaxID=474394 RepID=A0A1Y6IXK6_9VIBR|nr:hydrogenase 4 subunit B [Vibrio mangrovi]MDW6002038.1 hydrogenase 4 subunit B [Vibrio mangrovi]SMS02415.1 Hydrogenase-4 component B [Vibrio mangrovi]
MSPLSLLALSMGCYLIACIVALFGSSQRESFFVSLSSLCSTIGGISGVISAGYVLTSHHVWQVQLFSPFPFAQLLIRFDGLAAFMVMVISLIVIAASVYALHYMQEYQGKGGWGISLFLNLFVASMVALVVADNAFYFLVFFEMMSLASYFLVLVEQSEKSIRAGLQYFLIAHAGSVLIMIAFFMLYREAGTLNFADFSHLSLPAWESSVIFLLAFFGFGAKAGMITLHSWLPQAHPAAPSHASALMSGVMVKIGVFGIIKVGLVFLGGTEIWWGYLVLAFGAFSSVLGVMYALAEHDIKRLLAYHTVENVGIILMGVGVAMIGTASGQPVLAALGLLGGLYHLLNHAVFKGLLFLGAGSVISQVHTKDMEHMGGLGKLMPYTAITFLIGTMAISALPPLNGFVSEWFIYQSLFQMSQQSHVLMVIAGLGAVVMLAITGALACMCFVKVYGICFTGAPRTETGRNAREVGWAMITGTGFLALLCIVLGVGSPWISPYISEVATSTLSAVPITVQQGMALHPVSTTQAILSTPVITISLIVLLIVPFAVLSMFKKHRLNRRHQGNPWACGYAYEQQMTVSASGFTQPLRYMFSPVYRMRVSLDPSGWMKRTLNSLTASAAVVEPVFDRFLVQPCCHAALKLGDWGRKLQGGDFRVYCLYIVIALVVLLVFPFESGVK